MRIIVADDHQLIREGIKRILAGQPDVNAVAEAENAQQVLDLVRSGNWDVVVLDIKLPGKSGLDVLKELKEERPKLPVLILSMYPEEQFAVRVIRAGASGYLSKASAGDELLNALNKVYRGEKYISKEVADILADAIDDHGDQPSHTLLSDREFEVFRMIGAGKQVGEIAAELSLSVKTVSTYRSHILEKMKFKNNAEIMQYAITHKLID